MSRHLPKHDSKSGGLEKGSARVEKTAETVDSQKPDFSFKTKRFTLNCFVIHQGQLLASQINIYCVILDR